jgi:hypothetical protein
MMWSAASTSTSLSLIHVNRRAEKQIRHSRNQYRPTLFVPGPIPDTQRLVDPMKKILLATVAILAFSAPSFAAETAKTVGQAPPSFYLAQDSATLKCQIVEAQPAAGSSMKVVGAAHTTKASAETALKADKTCAK